MSRVVEVNESDNGREIDLRLRTRLRITLFEVPTAGFRWNVCPLKGNAASLIADNVEQPKGKLGGTLAHQWEFQAKKLGVVAILIEYGRRWQKAATRTFSVSVRVS